MKALNFGHPTTNDAEPVLALMTRCDIAEYGEPDSDLEDLTYEWGEIDLDRDAWLAADPDGRIVGYAAVLPWGEDLRLDFYSDPQWPDSDLAADLLTRGLTRARVIAARYSVGLTARTFVAHSNRRDLEIANRLGFAPGRYIFQMAIDLDRRPPAAQWPDGIRTRAAVPGQDDRQLHQMIQAAFFQPGRTPQSFEAWRSFMMRPDIFDPELWFLALDGAEIIGACLAYAYPTGGWARQLAVTERWQGKGVGKALLLATFDAFYARGFANVGLTVESKRPDAHNFYRAVGMRQVRQYDEFLVQLVEAGTCVGVAPAAEKQRPTGWR